MLKTERIEQYKGVFLRPGHAAFLNRSFAMTPAADADVVLDGGEDNLNLLLRDATGRGLAVARHYLVTPSDKVAAELDFVAFLAGHGFPTPPPIPTSAGGHFIDNGAEPSIALFAFVDGVHSQDWTAEQRRQGAGILADMHTLCDRHGYRIGRVKDRERILEDGLRAIAQTALADKGLLIGEVEAFLAGDWSAGRAALAGLPFGPVHHDLNSGNVFWSPNGDFLALIDFDEAHDAPYITDLVMAMHYLAMDETRQLDGKACRDLIAGYERSRPLSDAEKGSLQLCWDLANIVGAVEFVADNAPYLTSVLECKSFSELYLKNRGRLTRILDAG